MKTLRILLILNLFIISLTFGKRTENLKIEKVTGPYVLAEGPHWDAEKNLLYFVDINSQKILCYDPKTKITTHAYLKCGLVSVVVPVAGKENTFIAGCGTDLVQVLWNPRTNNRNPKIKIISKVDVGINDTRFNDGKVDPKGRFWGGTMLLDSKVADPPNQASLYRFAYDGTPTTMITPVSVSNGLVWSHTNDSFYYIDSQAYNIVVYDYDDTTGNICNKRVLLDLKKEKIKGIPDGMTIDKAGNLWVAINTGGKVIHVDSKNGKVLRSVKMPVTDVSSVAFGGPNKDILYVTTARDKLSKAQIKVQPTAGSVFAVHGLGTTGSPMLACRIK